MQSGQDLFAQQLQRPGHRLMRDQGTEIELGEDAVEAQCLVQLQEPVGDALRSCR